MKTLDSMLDKLGKVNCRLDGVRDSLDDNGIISTLVEELPCSLEVSTDSNSSSNSNLVSWEGILRFINSSIGFCHYFW